MIVNTLTELIGALIRPVRLPVGDFGESIVIGVVGYTRSGEPIAESITPRVLRCLPHALGHATHLFGEIVRSDFLHKFAGATPEQWLPPLHGLELGEWQEVEGFDKSSITNIALSMCALHVQPQATQDHEEDVAQPPPRASNETRFLEAVQAEVSRQVPRLREGFRRKFSLTGKASGGEVDFVGSHYATCFAAIDPRGRGEPKVQTAAAALWRLARARDAFGFGSPANIELTAWVPAPGQPIYSDRDYTMVEETVAELREQAQRENLGIFPAISSYVACERLLEFEDRVTLTV